MPEHGDGLARLLRDVDGPVPPRPEFTEALLERLLGELTGNPEVTASTPPPSPARPPMPSSTHPRGYDGRGWIPARRLYRFPTALATAALVLLTLVASFLAFGPGREARQQWAPMFIPAISGTPAAPQTVATDAILDVTTDALPAGHASIGVRRWTLRPSSEALTMPPLGGPTFITVAAGTITATVDGAEQRLTAGQRLTLAGDTAATFRAAGGEEAKIFELYVVPSFTATGRGLGEADVDSPTWAYDPVVYTAEYLITASPDGLSGGPSHLILDRLTLPPGSTLPPQQAGPLTWTEVREGVLGLTLEGERLPFRWTSGEERTFRLRQALPITQPGTQMTLRNAGDDPLVLYRLTLAPSEERASNAPAPSATASRPP
jgi:hypothetical protein